MRRAGVVALHAVSAKGPRHRRGIDDDEQETPNRKKEASSSGDARGPGIDLERKVRLPVVYETKVHGSAAAVFSRAEVICVGVEAQDANQTVKFADAVLKRRPGQTPATSAN